ncbi:MAG: hypothetical protein VX265_04770 [Myxococcota bacterium]|nr:hypothetical protein [Myxococcota bacterium]
MNRLLVVLLAALFAVGCAQKRRIRMAKEQPDALVSDLRSRPLPYALQALFNVKVSGPELQGTTTAGMVLSRPDRFNINVQTPLRTPLLYLASDGRVMHAYTHQDTTFYQGSDELAVLGELSGGAAGVPDLLLMLTGGLPLPEAEVLEVSVEDGLIHVELAGPQASRVSAWVDPKTELFRRLEIRSMVDGELAEPWVTADIPNPMHFQGGWLPEELVIVLPTLGWTVEITFHTWDELGVIPDVFLLEPPAGSTMRDLVETLRTMAEQQGVRPRP